MQKKYKMKKYKIDEEEQLILDAIENGDWELVKPKKSELGHYAHIAKNTFRVAGRQAAR